MEYHFWGRLHIAPQVRIQSQENTPGFSSLKECEDFCKRNMLQYVIFHRENGKKVYDIEVE